MMPVTWVIHDAGNHNMLPRLDTGCDYYPMIAEHSVSLWRNSMLQCHCFYFWHSPTEPGTEQTHNQQATNSLLLIIKILMHKQVKYKNRQFTIVVLYQIEFVAGIYRSSLSISYRLMHCIGDRLIPAKLIITMMAASA